VGNLGILFAAYNSSIHGIKESEENGPSYLSIPQPFFNVPDEVLSPGDIAEQKAKARHLVRILVAADKAFIELSKKSPHINKSDLSSLSIEWALKEVKK